MKTTKHSAVLGTLALGLSMVTALTGGAMAQSISLTYLIPNGPSDITSAEAIIAAFEAINPDISVEIETRPAGAEGDNIVKTRLATGAMTDVFNYNAGSLFQAMNPRQYLVDLSDEPWQANVPDTFKQVVTAPDGSVRGAPLGATMGGGIYYNKPLYEELGLSVPKTWADFIANAKKAEEAGKIGVAQTYTDTWTSQIIVLADYFNVQAANPDFAASYTAGTAKFATDPGALRGFEKLQELHDAGVVNEDYASATYDDGIRMVATGEAAHLPQLTGATWALANTYPEQGDDVGFFALPGDDAASNGLTVWMPNAVYIPTATSNLDAAKKFVAFIASPEGCAASMAAMGAASITGPYPLAGCDMPEDILPSVADMLPYFEGAGMNAPALEFLSPIKGPALEHILVEVGSGMRSATDAAALYDEDVRKQAQQLGLPGW